jgi:ATP-binding cassette subfamily F protein uup
MLLSLNDIDLRLGGPTLLAQAALTVETGERLALLGRNGAGKTSLLRVIAGDLLADAGERRLQPGVRTALLPQEIPTHLSGTVAEIAQSALGAMATVDQPPSEYSWQAERWLTEMGVDPEADFAALSGGMKRRVLLARALACEPDLLLLDEPTNHLDPSQIEWLEDLLLQRFKGCLLFISHDRRFIRRLASGILHLDRGKLTRWPGDLDRYLDGREAALAVEERHDALFDKHLAQEESWIRQGVKARRTRNEGRVRALEALRQQRAQRRAQTGQARIALETAAPSGRLVAELDGISHAFSDQRPLIQNFSTTLLRGDKVGIVGPNGCGKTTLLRILLGQLQPQQGRVRHGTRLEVAYFDQLRADLHDDERPVDVVGGGKDTVTI